MDWADCCKISQCFQDCREIGEKHYGQILMVFKRYNIWSMLASHEEPLPFVEENGTRTPRKFVAMVIQSLDAPESLKHKKQTGIWCWFTSIWWIFDGIWSEFDGSININMCWNLVLEYPWFAILSVVIRYKFWMTSSRSRFPNAKPSTPRWWGNGGKNFSGPEPIGKDVDMGVSNNNGTPKSSILIGFSIINHPFWGTPSFENTHMLTPWFEISCFCCCFFCSFSFQTLKHRPWLPNRN